MGGLVSVARREVASRGLVVAAALVAGVLARLVPRLAGAPAATVALVWSALWSLACAGTVVVGLSLGSEPAGFYFSRPLGAPAIFGGRLAGGALVALAAFAAVLLPAGTLLPSYLHSVGPGAVERVEPLWMTASLGGSAIWVFGFVAFGHALGVMARSRSPWILADVAAMVVVSGVLQLLGEPGREALMAVVLVAVVAAGAAATVLGRTDGRRAHRALSVTLWGLVLPASGALLLVF